MYPDSPYILTLSEHVWQHLSTNYEDTRWDWVTPSAPSSKSDPSWQKATNILGISSKPVHFLKGFLFSELYNNFHIALPLHLGIYKTSLNHRRELPVVVSVVINNWQILLLAELTQKEIIQWGCGIFFAAHCYEWQTIDLCIQTAPSIYIDEPT